MDHPEIIRELEKLHKESLELLSKAKAANDLESALGAVCEARDILSLLATLQDEFPTPEDPAAPVFKN